MYFEFKLKENIGLVLNLDSNGLGVIRSLGRAGIDVWGGDFIPKNVGLYSRFCKKKIILPSPLSNPDKCLEKLIIIGKEVSTKPVLLPTADYWVIFLSKHQTELSNYFRFNIPESGILDTIVDKAKQYQWAEKLGIPIPKTYYLNEDSDIHENDLTYPIFMKGRSGHKWATTFGNKGFVVNNSDEFSKYYEITRKNNIDAIVQEIIPGPNKNHYKVCAYYNKNKKLLALFSTQKARQYPVDFGVGSYMISKRVDNLIELGLKFFEGIGYTGVGSIEFKLDERDNQFKLIELNPRLWQQNIQATYSGVNFPLINFLDCIGVELGSILNFKENVRWLDAIQDFQSFIGNYKKGDVKFFEWFISLFKSNCFAYFAWDDLLPGWKNSNFGLKYLKLPYKLIK